MMLKEKRTRRNLLIFLPLTVLLLLAILAAVLKMSGKMEKLKKDPKLSNIIYWHKSHRDAKFNLNFENSDNYNNFVLMYQVVGTLLRNSSSGLFEPYLASSWEINSDGSFVKFNFKRGIKTQMGVEITPNEYYQSLHRIFKILGRKGSLLQFDGLKGIRKFLDKESENISGISFDKDSISFQFDGPTDDLLLNFTEPYWGFYSNHNFNSSGDWKSDAMLDSSGAYYLDSISDDLRTVLVKKNSSYVSNDGPEFIRYRYFSDASEVDDVIFHFGSGAGSLKGLLTTNESQPIFSVNDFELIQTSTIFDQLFLSRAIVNGYSEQYSEKYKMRFW